MNDAPFLDVEAPDFAMRSAEVDAARAQSWYARTICGIAILRYAEIAALVKDPRLIQGSARWPAHNGVTTGPFASWWSRIILCREGVDHMRLKRLVTPAFSQRTLTLSCRAPSNAWRRKVIASFCRTRALLNS